VDAAVIEAEEFNENFTDITDVVNGSIDGDNISTSAAISCASVTASGAITSSTTVTGADLAATDDCTVGDDLAVTGLATVGETLGVTGVLTASGGIVLAADKGIKHRVLAKATLAADQDNIENTTWTKILLDTENADIGSDFASNQFTVPVTGYYLVSAAVHWENTDMVADKNYACAIYVDPLGAGADAGVAYDWKQSSVASKYITNQIAMSLFYLTATDEVSLWCYNDSGGATLDVESGTSYTHLTIALFSTV